MTGYTSIKEHHNFFLYLFNIRFKISDSAEAEVKVIKKNT